jgi:predicted ATPase
MEVLSINPDNIPILAKRIANGEDIHFDCGIGCGKTYHMALFMKAVYEEVFRILEEKEAKKCNSPKSNNRSSGICYFSKNIHR